MLQSEAELRSSVLVTYLGLVAGGLLFSVVGLNHC